MHILVIEDDRRVAELIQRGLHEKGYKVTLLYSGDEALREIEQSLFDLIITDIMLPGLNGVDLCKRIREMHPELPIIMLTALGTTDEKLEGFDAGADDYMVKPFEMRELVARIGVLLKRSMTNRTTPDKLNYADIEMDLQKKTVYRNNQLINLTPKEFNLLRFMLENPERVLSRSEIAEKVWDTHFDTGTNFIDVYINYLRKKIEKGFDAKLIHTRSGMGFVLSQQ